LVPALRSHAPLPSQLLKGPVSRAILIKHVALQQHGRPSPSIPQDYYTKLWE